MNKRFKSEFIKSIITLSSGSIIAQIIAFAASPILTRLYDASDIGIYTLILTAVSIFSTIICGRYEMSIVTEPDERKLYPIIKLSIIICFTISILVSAGYWVYFALIIKSKGYFAAFIFILLICSGVINILISYNNRKKEYKLMTSVYVLRTAIQNIGMIILGFIQASVLGLLISQTLGQIFGLNRQAKSLKPYLNEIILVNKKEVIEAAKEHHRQPLLSAPASFVNNFSYSSINLFIQNLYGLSSLGFYSISYRVLGLPLSVVSSNVAKVFFEDASREYDKNGQFYSSFRKTTIFLIVLAIPMVLLMYFVVPPLCSFIFGQDWSVAGTYIKILAIMFGIRFIVMTLIPGLLIVNKQNYELILQILFVVASISCFIIAKIFLLSINQYLSSINISFSIIYILFYFVILRFARNKKGVNNDAN